jgi:malate dehydrogenase (oxaloacetate-decarboxylating)(NADP+)
MSKDNIYKRALAYHSQEPYGKLSIVPTKSLLSPNDLALAYSPGVAEPCRQIEIDGVAAARRYTAKGNLVAVISNGTAVLGLGDIGALASKPVMEGKAVLFKKFGGIDAFDIEINETDPQKLVDIIASLEPTFGGINLEDIKSPECFYIESELKKRMTIPVLHDDQHGTAVTVAAALLNALEITGKDISQVTLVASGAGAGGIACLNLLIDLGLKIDHILLCDSKGVIHDQRDDVISLDASKQPFIRQTHARTLQDAMIGADIFLGLSKKGLVCGDMVKSMGPKPIVFALANPEPEILPEDAYAANPDVIMATGRSDYPNQVNNAVCFPYIFRGALDVGAKEINQHMKIACVKAIANLAKAEATEEVLKTYGHDLPLFGKDFLIPKPFDRRLYVELSFAVAKAAIESGVATIELDLNEYYKKLSSHIQEHGILMRPIFNIAQRKSKQEVRIAFCEGESDRVLQAVQMLQSDNLCKAVLIGRPNIIEERSKSLGINLQNVEIVNPQQDDRFHLYWSTYHKIFERKGISEKLAKSMICHTPTAIGSLMVHLKDADAVICGVEGRFIDHVKQMRPILGSDREHIKCATLCGVVIESIGDSQTYFMADPYVNIDPTPEQLVDIILLSAQKIKDFDIKPKVALLSHSNFGTSNHPSAIKMRDTLKILNSMKIDFEVDGEMHGNTALSEVDRLKYVSNSPLKGGANLLIFPNIDAAHITFTTMKSLPGAQAIGPIMLGLKRIGHIMSNSTTSQGIFNMAVMCVQEFFKQHSQ